MVMDHCVLFPKEHIYSLIQVTSALSCHGDWLSNMKARELPWGKGGFSCSLFYWKTKFRYHDGKRPEKHVLDIMRKGVSTVKEELV